MVIVFLTLCLNIGLANADSNAGPQVLEVQTQFYPTTMTRYVAPGSSIAFRIDDINDFDTNFVSGGMCGGGYNEEVEDGNKQGRIWKYGGTVSGNFETFFSSTGYIDVYTVPSTASADQTIVLKAAIHDTRDSWHPMHDDWTDIATWTFVVSSACPTLSVHELVDLEPTRPNVGESYGNYVAVMQANGNPYPRANWNGTTFTEVLGVFTCNDTTEFIENRSGQEIEGGDTFTVGGVEPGGLTYTNYFFDWHDLYYEGIILRDGVRRAVGTYSQDYICKPDPSGIKSTFTVRNTCTNLDLGGPNERVKVVVTK